MIEMGLGRLVAVLAMALGLIGTVGGGLAVVRSAARVGAGNGRRGGVMAVALGSAGLALGGLVVALPTVVSVQATGSRGASSA